MHPPPRIGAEIEFLSFDVGTHRPALLAGSLGDWLRSTANSGGWQSLHSDKGAPKYTIPDAGTLTLEPGGQIEFSSQPFADVDALCAVVEDISGKLISSAAGYGVELMTSGIDPFNAIANVPLQLDAPRYLAMDEFFGHVSAAGHRMMRQTAALQVSVDAALDGEADTYRTWRVLNRAAPVLTATFANSHRYAGGETGYASYRAQTWLELDPTRTGLFGADDAIAEYTAFARHARVIADAPRYRRFADIPDPGDAAWHTHLTTLFPEVRPKGYYEVRCIDSIPLKFVSVAIVVVAALAWDSATLNAVERELPRADRTRWEKAARYGLADAELAKGAGLLASYASAAFPGYAPLIDEWMQTATRSAESVAAGRATFENDLVGHDHVADDALACFGE
jgi:glutamate--cysteine ligase